VTAALAYDFSDEVGEPLPAAARRLRLGMPHLDVGGLSEGWLFRHAGDLHWEAIGRRLGVATDQIRDEARQRIYPTVVALRARYGAPLSDVRENDIFSADLAVMPCGRACAQGRIAAAAGPAELSLELVTTFALRRPDGAMRTAIPAARLAARWTPIQPASHLAQLARAARRGEPLDDPFVGPAFAVDPQAPPLGRVRHQPSPYADYNGAGLLYFAAYPTIADTAERRIVRRLGLSRRGGPDWAVATSPVARDVFYYGNLPLGDALVAELVCFTDDQDGVKTRVRLRRARGGQPIADVVTRRIRVRERRGP